MAIPRHQRKWKLAPAREKGVLLGYEKDNTLDRILRLNNKKVAISKHATFDKFSFPDVNQGLPLTNPMTSTNQKQFIVETNSAETVDDQSLSKNLIQSVLDLILLSTPIPKGTKAMVFSTTR
ncbi:hypothetical protein O181_011293 [Austropuccinia psidii MF-1]|uniref:Retroviral polymerase SH3-like domain-containing protein n=1 Tax=Austropuccinia psidii MF-1 TaxID=1389203 RepID=A0A9Q3GL58_9BASI|nr:hypothetical protein [Austropuccinia psidii MF-1]